MNKNSSQLAKAGSNAGFLPATARPPHDPLRIPLDQRVGWRLSDTLLDQVEVSPLDGALVIAADPASGRQLNEASGSFGGLTLPPNITLGSDGNPILLDWTDGSLKRFDPCSCIFEVIPCTGGFGNEPRQLGPLGDSQAMESLLEETDVFPGIAAYGGNLFVADPGNHRVQVFSLHGFVLRGFWQPPPEQQVQAWQPTAVAFDCRGNVLVSDPANGCVHQFNPGGRWLRCIDGVGAVRALATDCNNQLYLFTDAQTPVAVYSLKENAFVPGPDQVNQVSACFDPLPLMVTPEGCMNLSALCLADPAEAVLFDGLGNPVKSKQLSIGHTFAQQATYISTALDSQLYRCQWDRISFDAKVPEGTRIKVSTYNAETELSEAQILDLQDDAWAFAAMAFPGTTQAGWDCLVRSVPGRYLWLRLDMLSDGDATPRIQRILVDFPRISLRRYLPAVVGEEPVAANFTDRFLAIFDRGFRSVESQLDQLSSYFDPMSAPAEAGTRDFLGWLASWIGLRLDRQLPLERQRHLVKQAGKLFPLRGTLCGLRKNLELYLGLDRLGCQQRADCTPCTTPAAPKWQQPQLILEHYRLRRWMFLSAGRLGDQSRLWGQSIVNRSQLSGPQTNGNAQLGVSQLKTTQDPFRDPLHHYAHKFSVFVPGCIGRSPRRRKNLERLIELEKPAHTAHQLIFVEPRFRIGVQSMIGFDAVIGCYPEGVVLNQSGLGKASVLTAARQGGPQLRIDQQSRIGTTTSIN